MASPAHRVGDAHDVDHRRTLCTRTMWAPPRTLAATAAAVRPVARRGRALADRRLQEGFARRPGQDRAVEHGQLVEAGQRLEAVLGALGEANAGIEDDRLAAHPGRLCALDRLCRARRTTSAMTSV